MNPAAYKSMSMLQRVISKINVLNPYAVNDNMHVNIVVGLVTSDHGCDGKSWSETVKPITNSDLSLKEETLKC